MPPIIRPTLFPTHHEGLIHEGIPASKSFASRYAIGLTGAKLLEMPSASPSFAASHALRPALANVGAAAIVALTTAPTDPPETYPFAPASATSIV